MKPAQEILNNTNNHLCNFFSAAAKEDNAVIRMILFGGSVTVGSDAFGCCCQLDVNCPLKGENSSCYETSNRDGKFCTWNLLFRKFMRTWAGEKKFQFISFAHGGTSSPWAATLMTNKAEDAYSMVLQPTDIIFIDYSVNDGNGYSNTRNSINVLQDGLESLVRELHSKVNGTFPPNIVILEQWPFGTHPYPEKAEPSPSLSALDYITPYRTVGSHYGLPVWSMREVAWSNYTKNYQSKLFAEYIR